MIKANEGSGDKSLEEIEITPQMIEAGKLVVMENFPGEWEFGRNGIDEGEARLLALDVLKAALNQRHV